MFKVVKDKDDTLNKSQDKELTTLFINKFSVSDFRTRFFFRLVTRLEHGSSYRG